MTAKWIVPTVLLVTATLAGCVSPDANGKGTGEVREIRMWVEQMAWPIHPNVDKTVWAFCAEGDGVEYFAGVEGRCSVPAPTIRVTKGDRIELTFENTHTIPHTVHFHGWHTMGADMNGAALVGDAMLVDPGETAVIEWIAEPAGSFIFHCHFQTPAHMDMGMYGAFIVEDPEETGEDKPDVEYVAVLDEWQVGEAPEFLGSMPVYNFFTINAKSFPTTEPIIADPGDKVRIHMVNAGFEFHAMHLHGYTPWSYEGVAGPSYAVPTDVREIAPGQTVVLDLDADRPGLWLFHDHIVPSVTAAAEGAGFGAYPRGMLTMLVVGDEYVKALQDAAPELLRAAARDALDPGAGHADARDSSNDPTDHASNASNASNDSNDNDVDPDTRTIDMVDLVYAEANVTVPAGTTLAWVNKDPFVHTVTFDDGSMDSGDIGAAQSFSYTFDEPGTYAYHCTPHAFQDKETGEWRGMVATVTVTPPATRTG